MEDIKLRYCKLCLTTPCGENDSYKSHMFKFSFDDDSKHEICNACSTKLWAVHKFKSTCFITDSIIYSYVSNTEILPLDLREIYMKERAGARLSDDIKICRLCLQPVEDISEFKEINEQQVHMILKLVPEMNIFTVKEPVMCKLCFDFLRVHYNFLKKYSDVIRNISNVVVQDASSPEPSFGVSVKIEDVDDEFGDSVPELIKMEPMDINYGGIKIEREIYGQETSEAADLKEQETSQCKPILNNKDPSNVPVYKCETCYYKTKRKAYLKIHRLRHKDRSEVEMYKCKVCDFETKHKKNLASHMVIHKDPLEVQMHKCEVCDYENKHKYTLKRHMLVHKNLFEVKTYKCENCTYETKFKYALERHMLRYKDPSELQSYKCEHCNYETTYKRYLNDHMLTHKNSSEVPMYKCENCDFETKYKRGLKSHMLVHKDSSEVPMYKCVTCNYESKYETTVKRHMLTHKDPSEVQMYKCEKCEYKTKYKPTLNRHLANHKDSE